jgi:transglutaminase-like putative cysteine protease
MKWCRSLLVLVQLLTFSDPLQSQSGKPLIANEPAWISKNPIDYNKVALDKEAADGYIDLSFELQIYLATQSEYCKTSKKIISNTGVQNASQVSVSFDPLYQQLIFHNIHVIRKGEIINKLKLANIKILHQEEELNNFIYNGNLNAVLILDDIRQGDIIEYSYTLKGFNPIFKNKYSVWLEMEYTVPVYQLYYKLVVPPGRKMNIKNSNDSLLPVITELNGQQIWEWRRTDIPAALVQDYKPSWHAAFDKILISEYNNWKEVNDWALDLFPGNKILSAPLQKKIKEIEAGYTSQEDRLKAALRFVQDDIRYMGIEMGESSHRPADPSKVYEQRFGDCKEKSFLLCCMLRVMNVEASPVLINTYVKNNLHTLLPAPTAFNHVTVRVKLNNEYYWYDPTIANQRGDVKTLFYPDYQAGLVVTDSTTSLTSINFRKCSYQKIKNHFKVASMYGPGSLTVTSHFKGEGADVTRKIFNNTSIADLMDNYQKFYAAHYKDIKADSLLFSDDDSTGIFKTIEYYSIPLFWTVDKNQVSRFSFSAFVINNVLRRPKDKERTMPFALNFPATYEETTIVDLPSDWKVTESETHFKNGCFNYDYKFHALYNQVFMEATYENVKDHVTVQEAAAYFRDLDDSDENSVFELTSGNTKGSPSDNFFDKDTLLSIFVIAIIIAAIVWWSRRR